MLRTLAVIAAAVALTAEGGSRMTEAADGHAGGLLLVANKGEHTLGLIDPIAVEVSNRRHTKFLPEAMRQIIFDQADMLRE